MPKACGGDYRRPGRTAERVGDCVLVMLYGFSECFAVARRPGRTVERVDDCVEGSYQLSSGGEWLFKHMLKHMLKQCPIGFLTRFIFNCVIWKTEAVEASP